MATAAARAAATAGPDPTKLSHVDMYVNTSGKGKSYHVDFVDGRFQTKTIRPTIMTKETIYSRVTSYKLCDNKIGDGYIKSELANSQLILVAYGTQKPLDRPLGFIFAYPTQDKKGVYLSIICALGVGRHLLDAFFQVSEHIFKYQYIELNALPAVLSYYPQFEFEHKGSCTSPPDVRMSDSLKQKIKSKEIKPDEIIDTIEAIMDQKQQINLMYDVNNNNYNYNANNEYQAMHKPLDDALAEYDGNEFLDYLQQLRDHGYVADTTYEDEYGDEVSCNNSDLDIYDFIGKGCHSNGFTMRKCFRRADTSASARAATVPAPDTAPAAAFAPKKAAKSKANGKAKKQTRKTIRQRIRRFFQTRRKGRKN